MTSVFDWLTTKTPASSSGHVNAQITNGALQVTNQAVQGLAGTLNPWAIIPTAFTQTLISGYSVFREDTHVHEKLIHSLQALLSAAETGLSITLLFQHASCTALGSNVCLALALCQTLYGATLVVTGSVGFYTQATANSPLLFNPVEPKDEVNEKLNQEAANSLIVNVNDDNPNSHVI